MVISMSAAAAQAHRASTEAQLSEIARLLQEVLSGRLTAVIAGVKDTKTVDRWVSGETADVRNLDTEERLRAAFQIVRLLLQSQESPEIVKAWFIGLNPQLGDISPVEAIREGRLTEAVAAARAFMAGG